MRTRLKSYLLLLKRVVKSGPFPEFMNINGTCVKFCPSLRNLGVTLDSTLTTSACPEGLPHCLLKKIHYVQNAAAKMIFQSPKSEQYLPLLHKLHWLSISCRIEHKISSLCYCSLSGTGPQYLSVLIQESDTNHKKECRWNYPLSTMALRGSITGESSTDNTLAFSSITGEATMCEQQFTRLKTFLTENTLFRSEVLNLLFPVFVHMYIELLSNGHKTPAHKFFTRHNALFKSDMERLELLEQLSKLYSRADMISCKEVQAYKYMKYQVDLLKEEFDCLHKYLKNDDNMVVVQIFNQHIQLQVKTDTGPLLGLADDNLGNKQQQPISPAVIPDNKVVQDDQALSSLKQIIKEVRDGPPGLPSICFYTFLNAYQGLCCASTSSNGEFLSGGFEDSSVRLWKLKSGLFPPVDNRDGPSVIYLSADYMQVKEDHDIKNGCEQETVQLKGHAGCVYQSRFTWDSNLLLTCSDDTTVRLWDVKSQTNMAVYKGHNYPVWDLDVSGDVDYFATCSHDQTAKLWSTERTYPLRSFIGHTYDVDCVRFHPNSLYIATGSGDKTVRLWDIQEGKSVRLMSGHRSSVLCLAFSSNGLYLASAGEDRRIRVWDLRTGTLFKEFRGHTDTVYALSFNQSSSILASGGLDSCIRIWDLRESAVPSLAMPDHHNSAELMGAFPTKSTPVIYLNFTSHNILQAAGAV